LWDLFPTDQDATYAQSYTPIVLVPPFNITEAIEGVTLSGGKVQMLTYSLTPVATPIEGVTLSGGTLTQQVVVEVPAASVVVAAVVPEIEATVPPVAVDVPTASVVVAAVVPEILTPAVVAGTIDWTPDALPDLELWLDSYDLSTFTLSGNTVTEWRDRSGNDRHMVPHTTASNQILASNSEPLGWQVGVRFPVSGNLLKLASLSKETFKFLQNEACTVFCVSHKPTAGWATFISTARHDSEVGRQIGYGTSGTNIIDVSSHANNGGFFAAARINSDSSFYVNTPVIHGFELEPALYATTTDLCQRPYRNGTWIPIAQAGSTWNNGAFSNATPTYELTVGGGYQIGPADVFNGLIFDLLIFRGILPERDRQKVEGYLAHKRNLLGNLPAGHPFKVNPPEDGGAETIVVDTPAAAVVAVGVAPAIITEIGPIPATYSQRSVYFDNSAATPEKMTDGIAAGETMETGTNSHADAEQAWIQMDFGTPTSFSSVTVGAYSSTLNGGWGNSNLYIDNADIVGSDDESSWTTIVNIGTMPTTGERIAEFSTPGETYRYVRIRRSGYLACCEFYALP